MLGPGPGVAGGQLLFCSFISQSCRHRCESACRDDRHAGFHNFWFIEPEQKLRIHFDPGSLYSCSGEGFSLLQFTIENAAKAKGLGLDVKDLANAIFARLGMTRTSLQWRGDFRDNLAAGWNDKGEPQEHDERSNVRVAGSMDTTISDLSTFVSALVRGASSEGRIYSPSEPASADGP